MSVPYVKPCPFCGAKKISFYQTSPKEFVVYCEKCGGKMTDRIDAQAAVDKWNCRDADAIATTLPLDAAMFMKFHRRNVPAEWLEE